jgi:hypothetical protein
VIPALPQITKKIAVVLEKDPWYLQEFSWISSKVQLMGKIGSSGPDAANNH